MEVLHVQVGEVVEPLLDADAELYDGSGTVLGFGALDGGVDTDTSCVFSATFTADESSDGTYRITAGNSNRGFLNYDDSDVIDGVPIRRPLGSNGLRGSAGTTPCSSVGG